MCACVVYLWECVLIVCMKKVCTGIEEVFLGIKYNRSPIVSGYLITYIGDQMSLIHNDVKKNKMAALFGGL